MVKLTMPGHETRVEYLTQLKSYETFQIVKIVSASFQLSTRRLPDKAVAPHASKRLTRVRMYC